MTPRRDRYSRALVTLPLFAAGLALLSNSGAIGQPPPNALVQPMPGQPGMEEAGQPGAVFQPGPSRPMSPEEIERAIDRGVSWLRQAQKPTGNWGEGNLKSVGSAGGWVVGYTCLAGLALVECGVPTSDPGLQAARRLVLAAYRQLDSTYEVALAILFLDRMGDSKDRPEIQGLAVRLIAGQTGTGGWSYKVPLKITGAEHSQILSALKKIDPPPPPSLPTFRERPGALGLCIKMSDDIRPKPPEKAALDAEDRDKVKAAALRSLPPGIRRLPVFMEHDQLPLVDPAKKNSEPVGGTTDNSNTHFAMLGLWAARRHEVPTERSFALLFRRYRTSQNAGGGWGYTYVKGGSGGSNAMTCIALLGVAIGHALNLQEGDGPRPENDPMILKAFTLLSRQVGEPTGQTNVQKSPKDAGGLYYLWALERIAVLYDVQSLDRKDWYQWGAEILVGHQQPDGSWKDGGGHVDHPVLSTSLALLFLKRANLTPDLSKRLLVDPAALTATVSAPKSPAPMPKPMAPPEASLPPFTFPLPLPTPEPEPKTETEGGGMEETAPQAEPTTTEPEAASPDNEDDEESSGIGRTILAVIIGVVVLGGAGGFGALRARGRSSQAKGKKKGKGAAAKRKRAVEDVEEEIEEMLDEVEDDGDGDDE